MPEKEKKPTQTQFLLSLVSSLDMFHTREGEVYAKIPMDDHIETWNVRSKGFKRWLSGLFYQSQGKAPSAQAMNDALTTAEGIGQFERPEGQVT